MVRSPIQQSDTLQRSHRKISRCSIQKSWTVWVPGPSDLIFPWEFHGISMEVMGISRDFHGSLTWFNHQQWGDFMGFNGNLIFIGLVYRPFFTGKSHMFHGKPHGFWLRWSLEECCDKSPCHHHLHPSAGTWPAPTARDWRLWKPDLNGLCNYGEGEWENPIVRNGWFRVALWLRKPPIFAMK